MKTAFAHSRFFFPHLAPFQVLFDKIRTGDWSFYDRDWDKISPQAKELIRGLLVVDPKERWSIREALRCQWINQDPSALSNVNLSDSLVALQTRRNRLRTLAKAVMWMRDSTPCDVPTQAQLTSEQLMKKGEDPTQNGASDAAV